MRIPSPLRAVLTGSALACATISMAQSTAAPSAPVDSLQTIPAPQQSPVPASGSDAAPAAAPSNQPAQASPIGAPKSADKASTHEPHDPGLTEEQLKQQLAGKTFYLRGGYQDNTLHFNEKGDLEGSSPRASYTLSLVEIDRVKLDKHHLELEGVRYGVHFLGALPTEDQSANIDKVKLTSKKKPLKITIDREIVVPPKKQKEPKPDKKKRDGNKPLPQPAALAQAQEAAITPQAQDTAPPAGPSFTESTRHGMTVVTSHPEADKVLRTAIDRIFSAGIDDRMIATLPDYWKLYYKAIAEKAEYKPVDPAVLRSSQVDKKPRLTMAFEPPSNEYAQNNGVAGMAMYHVIVGPDGKPQDVAVGRPIGFGLDENAVDAIRKASFEPGMKDGKPVPVEVDLTVQFRIYSNRTAAQAGDAARVEAPAAKKPALPGPYSVNLPVSQHQ
jgi:TonB family protein